MDSVDVIRVSELLNRSQPCTAACSLQSPSSHLPRGRPIPPPASHESSFGLGKWQKDSNFTTLEVLDRPPVLIGCVVLPTEDVLKTCECPGRNSCLVFLDGDAGICCDILSFDVGVIRRQIRVLAWNYIPFKGSGGFLEIIRWEFLDSGGSWMKPCSGVSSLQLESTDFVNRMDDPKARYFVHGFVDAVSPVKVPGVGDKENDSATSLRGFLVHIMSCQCKLCKSKDSEVVFRNVSKGGSSGHCYDKCVTGFFPGSAASLHPVMIKLTGRFVILSFLRKKMVFIGKKEGQLMYIIGYKSLLRVLKLINRQPLDKNITFKGKGESGVYIGVIRGIYMQGMIMELENEVWLLDTDRSASLIHSLRVGALISLKNVHFVKCKFSWAKNLILGRFVKTIINVQCFSPLTTSSCISTHSPSQLGKFIDSLAFSARLWVLLLIASFSKKFAGILSDKEILGSKHNGVFMEFCHHVSSDCAAEANYDHLKLVLPISNFIHRFGYSCPMEDKNCPLLDFEGSNSLPNRKIVSSEDINVVLIGRLQISPSTGRFQLVDATGGINIIISGLSFNLDAQKLYEINKYYLVIEDRPASVDTSALKNKLFSFREVFQYCPPSKADIVPYVFCNMENVNIINPSSDWDNNLNKVRTGTFDVLKLTHKFPLLQNAGPAISDNISMFAEAVVLPWKLTLDPKCSNLNSSEDCDGRAEVVEHIECESGLKTFCNKRRKCEYVPRNGLGSSLKFLNGTVPEAANPVNDVFVPCIKSCPIQTCDSGGPVQLPCSIIIRSGEKHIRNLPGLLDLVKSDFFKKGSKSAANADKILIEFKSDSFLDYEALEIGGYYILKNEKREFESSRSSKKVVITPLRRIWSLSFTYTNSMNDVLAGKVSQMDSCNDDTDKYSKVLRQTELLFQRSNTGCSRISSDVEVRLSSKFKSLLEGDSTHTQEDSFNSVVKPYKVTSSLALDSGCRLPVGKLISFHGHVMRVESFNQEPVSNKRTLEEFRGFSHRKYHQGTSTRVRIHVLLSNDTVMILLCSNVHTFPIGFGPGVDAHFRRILHSRNDEYLLTPASFVEITSIKTSIKHNIDDHSSLSCVPKASKVSTFGSVASGLINQMTHFAESEPLRIRCRVLAIHILVFEKNDSSQKDIKCNHADHPNIPLSGFILDDGSSTCCCWAKADKAAAFLKMDEEVPSQASESRRWFENRTASRSTASYLLNKILKKHQRITVKNYGSACELPGPDLIVSASPPAIVDESDEEMVKCIVINACVGTPLNVVGSVMDPDAVKQLEKHVREMEMTLLPMLNIWAEEVFFPNALHEARDLIRDLL
uniref:CST complex subunit CTC1 n=1 Tax=Kalanchoe fedtschenkoi TaxID=63787 RepID=A0A7N0TPT0_KALFE